MAKNYIAYLSATLDGQPVQDMPNKVSHHQKMVIIYALNNSIYVANFVFNSFANRDKKTAYTNFLPLNPRSFKIFLVKDFPTRCIISFMSFDFFFLDVKNLLWEKADRKIWNLSRTFFFKWKREEN